MPTIDLCARHHNATIVGPSSEEACVICQAATNPEADEARARLLQALPHFRFAMKLAAKNGAPMVGILSVAPDGSGSVEAKFAAPDFFDDLALVLGAPAQTTEDDMTAGATKLMQQVERGLVDIGGKS